MAYAFAIETSSLLLSVYFQNAQLPLPALRLNTFGWHSPSGTVHNAFVNAFEPFTSAYCGEA